MCEFSLFRCFFSYISFFFCFLVVLKDNYYYLPRSCSFEEGKKVFKKQKNKKDLLIQMLHDPPVRFQPYDL